MYDSFTGLPIYEKLYMWGKAVVMRKLCDEQAKFVATKMITLGDVGKVFAIFKSEKDYFKSDPWRVFNSAWSTFANSKQYVQMLEYCSEYGGYKAFSLSVVVSACKL